MRVTDQGCLGRQWEVVQRVMLQCGGTLVGSCRKSFLLVLLKIYSILFASGAVGEFLKNFTASVRRMLGKMFLINFN